MVARNGEAIKSKGLGRNLVGGGKDLVSKKAVVPKQTRGINWRAKSELIVLGEALTATEGICPRFFPLEGVLKAFRAEVRVTLAIV